MIKYSRQRESIVNFLASRTDHPTAETIYQNIKKEFPNISLGTVYRNLSLLEEIGEIIKISTGVGPDHYGLQHSASLSLYMQRLRTRDGYRFGLRR